MYRTQYEQNMASYIEEALEGTFENLNAMIEHDIECALKDEISCELFGCPTLMLDDIFDGDEDLIASAFASIDSRFEELYG